MAQNSFPFETQDTTEAQYSQLFNELQDTGVAGDNTTGMAVTVATGMNLSLSAGYAIIRGFLYENTDPLTLAVDAADLQPRIDTVILRLDPAANNILAVVKKGTPNASPAAPALTQNVGGTWEIPLANILIPASATALSGVNLTDRRTFLGSQVGLWATSTRPTTVDRGRIGFNITTSQFEWWNGSAWTSTFPLDVALADSAVTTSKIANSAVTTSKIADSNVTTAKIADSNVTTAKIADANVTDAKLATPPRRYLGIDVNNNTTLTLTSASAGRIIRATNNSGLTVTINADSLAEGDRVDFIHGGVGAVIFSPAGGVSLISKNGNRRTNGLWTAASLTRINNGEYLLVGDLIA